MVHLKILVFSTIFMHWEVITEVYAHKTKDILPVSNSPNQVWYKELHGLIGKPAFIILPSGDQSYVPNQPNVKHPLFRNLKLLARHVSEISNQ